MKLKESGSNNTIMQGEGEEFSRKRQVIASLYQYSDLSVKNIAQQVDMSPNEVQGITDELAKSEGLQSVVEQSITKLEKIMSSGVVSIDISRTVGDAAALMTEKKVGSVIVTKQGRPFGIITERDLVRGLAKKEDVYLRATLLESFASYPLITAKLTTTVEEAAQIMFKNKIRRLPIISILMVNTSTLFGVQEEWLRPLKMKR